MCSVCIYIYIYIHTLYYIRQPYEHPNGFLRWAVLRTIKSNFTFIIVPILYGRNSVQHNWSTWSTIYPVPTDLYIVSRKRVAMWTTSGALEFYIEFGFHYDSRLQSKNDLIPSMAIRSSLFEIYELSLHIRRCTRIYRGVGL